MNQEKSIVSIIIPTYNRAHTLPRAIGSVLAQDYPHWELVIVDDGSTDNTTQVLAQYNDPRIKIVKHSQNRGVTAAENTGLDVMSGEWFTFLGSDDEIVPYALQAMLQPLEFDPTINAITCNCTDSVTGRFSGLGLDCDQYLSFETMLQRCRGEHWGITKHILLGDLRFNEQIPLEGILWTKISKNANRYYMHQGLRIYHTEGQDRISKPSVQRDLEKRRKLFTVLQNEKEYLEILRLHQPDTYTRMLFNLALVSILDERRDDAMQAYREIKGKTSRARDLFIRSGLIFGSTWMKMAYRFAIGIQEKFI